MKSVNVHYQIRVADRDFELTGGWELFCLPCRLFFLRCLNPPLDYRVIESSICWISCTRRCNFRNMFEGEILERSSLGKKRIELVVYSPGKEVLGLGL